MRALQIRPSKEAGAAFVIGILLLFVLTVLGLALMLTASTESDVAVNYRWGEMAFYNADAGLEFAKNVLAAYATRPGAQQFRDALPPPRGVGQMGAPPAGGQQGRDYQYSIQTSPGITVYIGKVLTHPVSGQRYEFDPYSGGTGFTGGDLDRNGAADLQGTVTLWVRRPIMVDHDYDKDDMVIITAEGTAPNYEGLSGHATSLRRLELLVRVQAGTFTPSLAHAMALGGTDTVSSPTRTSSNVDVPSIP